MFDLTCATYHDTMRTMSTNTSTASTRVGERIRWHRRARGLSTEQLAVAAGLTGRTVLRIELGQNNPRFDTLKAIADALGIDFVALLEEAS